MTPLSILLAASSLLVLVLSVLIKRISDSRSSAMNCFFASACLLFAAYQAISRSKPEWIVMLPFLALMLFAGRSLGIWLRVRKERELLPHARLLSAGFATCLVAAIASWVMH